MSKTKNRPEIDGLRAVAVIPVVLYHAGLGIKGGYVGVDVFFVISGFLITSLIISDLNALSFSLANFWERRVRRRSTFSTRDKRIQVWPSIINISLLLGTISVPGITISGWAKSTLKIY